MFNRFCIYFERCLVIKYRIQIAVILLLLVGTTCMMDLVFLKSWNLWDMLIVRKEVRNKFCVRISSSISVVFIDKQQMSCKIRLLNEANNYRLVGFKLKLNDYSFGAIFSARCNIYISRLCYDASVRLSVRLSVTFVYCGQRCNGSRISLHAWIDGCFCYLLTTPHPDRRMGWCRDFWWMTVYFGIYKK